VSRGPARAGLGLLAALMVAGLPALTACSGADAPRPAGDKLGVVAGTNVWGDVARQVGGDRVSVTSVLSDPAADPHLYSASARDAAAISAARVVVVNGLGYDAFMDKLLAASVGRDRVVVVVADVVHAPADANPHLWYDPAYPPLVARAVADQLGLADAPHAADYRARADTFTAALAPWTAAVTAIRSRYAGATVAVTEPVPGYLIAAAGLTDATPESFAKAIEDGVEPPTASGAAMDALLSGHRVRALLYNSQATSPVTRRVQDLAHSAGVTVVPVTETLPPGEPDLQHWQADQARALLTALGG